MLLGQSPEPLNPRWMWWNTQGDSEFPGSEISFWIPSFSTTVDSKNSIFLNSLASEPNLLLKFSCNSIIYSLFFFKFLRFILPSQDALQGNSRVDFSDLMRSCFFLPVFLDRRWKMLNFPVHKELPKLPNSPKSNVGWWHGELLLPHHPLIINKTRKIITENEISLNIHIWTHLETPPCTGRSPKILFSAEQKKAGKSSLIPAGQKSHRKPHKGSRVLSLIWEFTDFWHC